MCLTVKRENPARAAPGRATFFLPVSVCVHVMFDIQVRSRLAFSDRRLRGKQTIS